MPWLSDQTPLAADAARHLDHIDASPSTTWVCRRRFDSPRRTMADPADRDSHPRSRLGPEDASAARANAPSSLSPTSKPSTSRLPSARTAVATVTAWETTRG